MNKPLVKESLNIFENNDVRISFTNTFNESEGSRKINKGIKIPRKDK